MPNIKYKDKKLGRKRKGTFTSNKKVKGFAAKYPGICMICKKHIAVDTMIGWFAYGKVYHVECIADDSGAKAPTLPVQAPTA